MPDFHEMAEMQFARLKTAEQCTLARRVFCILEYDGECTPGVEWSSDTTQALGELFGMYGVTFTSPNRIPTTYRYNDHRATAGNRCPHALQIAPSPADWGAKIGPPWCPGGCIGSVIEGGTQEQESEDEPRPSVDRDSTAEELADSIAVPHSDGSASWRPTVTDVDGTNTDEMRASGHPTAQAADHEPPEPVTAQHLDTEAAPADEQPAGNIQPE